MGGLFKKEPAIGEIGRYELLELLTEDDERKLYRVRRKGTRDQYQLKLLTFGDPERDRRLLRSIQLLLLLKHPHILPLEDWGSTDDNRHFFITEPPGELLKIPATGGKPAWVLEVLGPICAAVHYLHGQGIVHRDLRPDIIAMDPEGGKARLIEFGLMRPDESKRAITRTGSRVGTPAYMAPEQVAGISCTPATDQYSLGVLAYQMLTGRPPFEGDDRELMRHHAGDDVDLTGVAGAAVLSRMLSKDPAQRYPDVAAAYAALKTALS